jgi:hypothetical protein
MVSYIWSKAQLFQAKLQNKLEGRDERDVVRVGDACSSSESRYTLPISTLPLYVLYGHPSDL